MEAKELAVHIFEGRVFQEEESECVKTLMWEEAWQGGTRGSSMASGSSAWKERGTLSWEGKDHEKSLFGGARGVGCSQRS